MAGFCVEFLNGVQAILTLSIKYKVSISMCKCIIFLGVNSLNKRDLRCHAKSMLFTHVHRKAKRRRRKDESEKTKAKRRKDEGEKTKRRKRKDEKTKANRRKDESEKTKAKRRKDEKTKAKRRKDESEKTLNNGLQGAY